MSESNEDFKESLLIEIFNKETYDIERNDKETIDLINDIKEILDNRGFGYMFTLSKHMEDHPP